MVTPQRLVKSQGATILLLAAIILLTHNMTSHKNTHNEHVHKYRTMSDAVAVKFSLSLRKCSLNLTDRGLFTSDEHLFAGIKNRTISLSTPQ